MLTSTLQISSRPTIVSPDRATKEASWFVQSHDRVEIAGVEGMLEQMRPLLRFVQMTLLISLLWVWALAYRETRQSCPRRCRSMLPSSMIPFRCPPHGGFGWSHDSGGLQAHRPTRILKRQQVRGTPKAPFLSSVVVTPPRRRGPALRQSPRTASVWCSRESDLSRTSPFPR